MAATYRDLILADTPIVYFAADNNTNNDGTLAQGAPTSAGITYTTGKWNQAFSMSGSSYITLPSSTNYYGDKTWSMEAWFKTTANANAYYTIFRRNSGSAYVLMMVRGAVGADNGKLEYYIANSGGSSLTGVSLAPVNDGNWHHGVVTSDGTNIQMYVDNVLQSNVLGLSGTINPTGLQNIGQTENGTDRFVGQLDELAIYDYALSSTQVNSHYTYTAPVAVPFEGWGIQL